MKRVVKRKTQPKQPIKQTSEQKAKEIEMMKALLPHLSGEQALVTQEELLKREYELLYLKGDVRSMISGPYRRLFRQESPSFRAKQLLKLCAPHLHAIYRDKKGYHDE